MQAQNNFISFAQATAAKVNKQFCVTRKRAADQREADAKLQYAPQSNQTGILKEGQ